MHLTSELKNETEERTEEIASGKNKSRKLNQIDQSIRFYQLIIQMLVVGIVVLVVLALVYIFLLNKELSGKVYVVTNDRVMMARGLESREPNIFVLRLHINLWVSYMFAFDRNNYKSNIEKALHFCDTKTGEAMVKAYDVRQYKSNLQAYSAEMKAIVDTIEVLNKDDLGYSFKARVIQKVRAGETELNVFWTLKFDVVQMGEPTDFNPFSLVITNLEILEVTSDDGKNKRNEFVKKKKKGETVIEEAEEEEVPELDENNQAISKKKKAQDQKEQK